jgi:adenosylcobinamide amidohydrolase
MDSVNWVVVLLGEAAAAAVMAVMTVAVAAKTSFELVEAKEAPVLVESSDSVAVAVAMTTGDISSTTSTESTTTSVLGGA